MTYIDARSHEPERPCARRWGKEMHVVVEFNSFKVPNKGFAYCYLAGIPLRRLHRTARRHREEDSYFGRL